MDKIKRHKELCEQLNEVYEQKNNKYGDSFGTSVQKYGMIAALTRISDKFHRIENLILTAEDGSDTDESLIDSLLDMSNYCLMTVIEMENGKDKDDVRYAGYPKNFITTTIKTVGEKTNVLKSIEDMAPSIKPEWIYNPRHEFKNN